LSSDRKLEEFIEVQRDLREVWGRENNIIKSGAGRFCPRVFDLSAQNIRDPVFPKKVDFGGNEFRV
jgi:hypothetical protein